MNHAYRKSNLAASSGTVDNLSDPHLKAKKNPRLTNSKKTSLTDRPVRPSILPFLVDELPPESPYPTPSPVCVPVLHGASTRKSFSVYARHYIRQHQPADSENEAYSNENRSPDKAARPATNGPVHPIYDPRAGASPNRSASSGPPPPRLEKVCVFRVFIISLRAFLAHRHLSLPHLTSTAPLHHFSKQSSSYGPAQP